MIQMVVMKKITPILLFLVALQATASIPLLQETFEVANDVNLGSIHSQNGWVLNSGTADVQTDTFLAGEQAVEIQNGEISHDLSSSNSAVWVRFQAHVTAAPDVNPTAPTDNASVAFFVNTNLNLTVYSNTIPIEIVVAIATDAWTQFDVYCDYSAQTWDLSMNGSSVIAGLPLYSTNQQPASVLIANNSPAAVYLDDLTITDFEMVTGAPDSDTDGLPDWWEQKYYGGVTAAAASNPSQNGDLSILQTYIAGVDPMTNDPFAISEMSGEFGILWSAQPERLYRVFWTPALQSNFIEIATATLGEFIDTDSGRTDMDAGFYSLKAEMK